MPQTGPQNIQSGQGSFVDEDLARASTRNLVRFEIEIRPTVQRNVVVVIEQHQYPNQSTGIRQRHAPNKIVIANRVMVCRIA